MLLIFAFQVIPDLLSNNLNTFGNFTLVREFFMHSYSRRTSRPCSSLVWTWAETLYLIRPNGGSGTALSKFVCWTLLSRSSSLFAIFSWSMLMMLTDLCNTSIDWSRVCWNGSNDVPLSWSIFASQGLRSALLIFTLDIVRRIFEVTRWRFICNAASGSCNQSERALQKAHVL